MYFVPERHVLALDSIFFVIQEVFHEIFDTHLKKHQNDNTDAVLAFLQILFLKCSADIYVN